ncbi:nucleotidyl transferase AbiEii/AbiGii toxin family protein [Oligoflexus tunisiensis]|uniref:nucleotidyl transferase AbiEii/AbiGii toxin family protein n=1 Tax=Oligoflexus tunisiensis TaxID=708132 RepID=UPI00114D2CE2|nr:nucleotidyl transferase AbiEii/AbiGii toxin family protein [Oligoflexus tunisiensis]
MDKAPLIDIDKDVLEGLNHLHKLCSDNFIIVGAAARDILMQYHKLQPSRATRDADLAVRIGSWDLYADLKARLIGLGFRQQRAEYNFHYKTAIFDIMPFGDIQTNKSEILWPQDGKVMNMLGFDDAFRTAHKFRTDNNIEIRIASLSSLVLLKTIAWNDRPRERPQDPMDIDTIISNYLEAGNFDRFYDENSDLAEMKNFTMERAGAALIGRDLYRLCSNRALEEMKGILERELDLSEISVFFQQMARRKNISVCIDQIQAMLSNMK